MNIDELIQQREKQIQTEKEKEKQLEEKAKLIIKEFLQHTENFVFKFDYIGGEYLKKSFVLSLDRKKYGFNAIEIYRISLRDCVTIDEKSSKPKTFKDKIFHFFDFKKNELPGIIYQNKITYKVCCYGGDKKPFCEFELNENQDFEKIFKLQELGVHNNAVCR